MTEATPAKADIIPYTPEYEAAVRSWIDSPETYHNVCRGTEFPPPVDVISRWQRDEVTPFMLTSAGKPVAYGELWNQANDLAVEIAHLLVDPAKREKGFGTAMARLLYFRAATRRGVTKVIGHVYNEDTAALRCFLDAGFELLGTAGHDRALKLVRIVR